MPEYPPRRPPSQSSSPFRGENLSHSTHRAYPPTHSPYGRNPEQQSPDRLHSRENQSRRAEFAGGRADPKPYPGHENRPISHAIRPGYPPQNTHRGSNYGGPPPAMPDYSGYPTDPPPFHRNDSTQKLQSVAHSSPSSSVTFPTHNSSNTVEPSKDVESNQRISSPPPPMSPFNFNDDQDEELAFNDNQSIATYSSDKGRKPNKKGKGVWPCCCCPPCCSRVVCVMVTFVIIVVVGVLAYLLWPKVPSGHIDTLSTDGSLAVNIQELPYYFNQNLTLRIYLNNYNILPLHLKKIEIEAHDPYNYAVALGSGIKENIFLPSKNEVFVDVPYQIQYQFSNVTDRQWQRFALACAPDMIQAPTANALPLDFIVSLHIPEITWISKVPKITYQKNFVC